MFCARRYGNLCHLARGGNLKETTDYLRSFGPWAIVVSFFSMSSSMPSDFALHFLSTANGVIFGLPLGITVSWLAETVGVVLNFLCFAIFA